MGRSFLFLTLLNLALVESRHVVIVGGGAAGLSAAVEAARTGTTVTILDKEGNLGGNSAKASSGMNAAETPYQAAVNSLDNVEKFLEDTVLSGGGDSNEALARVLAENSAAAIAFLGELNLPLPLLTKLGGHSHARTHRHETPAGARPTNMGFALISALKGGLKDVAIENKTRVTSLIVDGGAVKGVVADVEGKEKEIRADAVVLATGGYCASASMLKRFAGEVAHLPTTNGPFATGDGISLAEGAGAAMVQMDHVQIHPSGFVDPKDETNKVKWLAPEALRGAGGVLLNKDAQRFVNELGYRDEVSRAIMAHGIDLGEGQKAAWLIMNEEATKTFPLPGIYIKKGFVTVVKGYTALAELIGVSEDNVQATMAAYNGAAKGDNKDDFGKTTFPVTFSASDSLYAMRVTPSLHYVMGGLHIDTSARVLSSQGAPIPGLYAAGEVTGGVHGKNRLAGNGILDNVVFGRIAGAGAAHAAKEEL